MADEKPLFAAIMLKGTVKINRKVTDTLKNLRLSSINNCIILPADNNYTGMLKRVSEYVTWGEVSQEVLEKLLEKRGKLDAKKAKIVAAKAFKDKELKESGPVFTLSPPSGGLKAVRLNYPRGDVGYRGEEINNLISRMI